MPNPGLNPDLAQLTRENQLLQAENTLLKTVLVIHDLALTPDEIRAWLPSLVRLLDLTKQQQENIP